MLLQEYTCLKSTGKQLNSLVVDKPRRFSKPSGFVDLNFQPVFNLFVFNLLVMPLSETSFIIKPTNHCIAVQFGWFYRDAGQIGTPRVFQRVFAESVMHRIVMNIKDNLF